MIHAEHGGGNNSTFTTHVVSSTGTDTYSAVAASLGSLKGPKHGGANLKVENMFADIKTNVKNWTDDGEIRDYLIKIMNKEAFDKSGLIYGMGHAVYTISDPRAVILKEYARNLSVEKGREEEFGLYERVEKTRLRASDQQEEPFQADLLQRRLLQRLCIFHAWDSEADVYAHLRGGAYVRVERSQN